MTYMRRAMAAAIMIGIGTEAAAQITAVDHPRVVIGLSSTSADGCFTNGHDIYDAVRADLIGMGFAPVDDPAPKAYDFAVKFNVTTFVIEETGQCVASTMLSTLREMTLDGLDGNFSVNTSNSVTIGSGNLNTEIRTTITGYVKMIFSPD